MEEPTNKAPSVKVVTHFLVGAVLQVVVYVAKDTSWIAWCPDTLQPILPIVMQTLAALAAYWVKETNPPPSAFRG